MLTDFTTLRKGFVLVETIGNWYKDIGFSIFLSFPKLFSFCSDFEFAEREKNISLYFFSNFLEFLHKIVKKISLSRLFCVDCNYNFF